MMIDLKYNADGLIPVVAQDDKTGEVLMVAYMNAGALEVTLKEGKMCYYSRSRKKFWIKGEQSGNFQIVKSLHIDCDKDTILAKVEQVGGAACHEGYKSCFFRQLSADGNDVAVTAARVFDPKDVYGS